MEFIAKARISFTAAPICMMIMASALAHAGELRVSPAKLEFGVDVKSGELSLVNEGSRRFLLSVTASEWGQNIEGRDIYAETSDIVFYPKNIILESGGQQVIRVGTKGSSSSRERAYHLIIEETSQSNDRVLQEDEKRGKAIGLRSVIPIFVKPRREQSGWEIEKIGLSGGAVSVAVHNTGNAHVIVTSVSLRGISPDGRELFNREIAGWYLLSGASRYYQTDIPRDVCHGLARLDIEVKSDKSSLKEGMEVRKEMCAL